MDDITPNDLPGEYGGLGDEDQFVNTETCEDCGEPVADCICVGCPDCGYHDREWGRYRFCPNCKFDLMPRDSRWDDY